MTILPALCRAVSAYGTELVEAGQTSDARELLELAVSYHADAVNIYTTLAKIYQEAGETDKIQDLIRYASEINTLASKMITESYRLTFRKSRNTCPAGGTPHFA